MRTAERQRIVAFSVALVWFALTMGQASPNSAEQDLTDVLAGEKLADSGRLCFRLSFGYATMAPETTAEAKNTERLEYSWAPGGKFRLVLLGKDGPLRTIVSDGKAIDTGDKIWDARFAFDFYPHQSKESLELRLELDDLIWPYSQVLHIHLHPISEFGNKQTLESLKKRFDISIADAEPPDHGRGDTYLKLKWRANIEREDFVQVRHEAIAYVHARREAVGARVDVYCTRTDLTEIGGVGWIPAKCTWRIDVAGKDESESPPVVSELCAEQPGQAIDASEFLVDYDKSPMIPWPHGSRMKNFWYGIVNTFMDLLEGVSDGEIGD